MFLNYILGTWWGLEHWHLSLINFAYECSNGQAQKFEYLRKEGNFPGKVKKQLS